MDAPTNADNEPDVPGLHPGLHGLIRVLAKQAHCASRTVIVCQPACYSKSPTRNKYHKNCASPRKGRSHDSLCRPTSLWSPVRPESYYYDCFFNRSYPDRETEYRLIDERYKAVKNVELDYSPPECDPDEIRKIINGATINNMKSSELLATGSNKAGKGEKTVASAKSRAVGKPGSSHAQGSYRSDRDHLGHNSKRNKILEEDKVSCSELAEIRELLKQSDRETIVRLQEMLMLMRELSTREICRARCDSPKYLSSTSRTAKDEPSSPDQPEGYFQHEKKSSKRKVGSEPTIEVGNETTIQSDGSEIQLQLSKSSEKGKTATALYEEDSMREEYHQGSILLKSAEPTSDKIASQKSVGQIGQYESKYGKGSSNTENRSKTKINLSGDNLPSKSISFKGIEDDRISQEPSYHRLKNDYTDSKHLPPTNERADDVTEQADKSSRQKEDPEKTIEKFNEGEDYLGFARSTKSYGQTKPNEFETRGTLDKNLQQMSEQSVKQVEMNIEKQINDSWKIKGSSKANSMVVGSEKMELSTNAMQKNDAGQETNGLHRLPKTLHQPLQSHDQEEKLLADASNSQRAENLQKGLRVKKVNEDLDEESHEPIVDSLVKFTSDSCKDQGSSYVSGNESNILESRSLAGKADASWGELDREMSSTTDSERSEELLMQPTLPNREKGNFPGSRIRVTSSCPLSSETSSTDISERKIAMNVNSSESRTKYKDIQTSSSEELSSTSVTGAQSEENLEDEKPLKHIPTQKPVSSAENDITRDSSGPGSMNRILIGRKQIPLTVHELVELSNRITDIIVLETVGELIKCGVYVPSSHAYRSRSQTTVSPTFSSPSSSTKQAEGKSQSMITSSVKVSNADELDKPEPSSTMKEPFTQTGFGEAKRLIMKNGALPVGIDVESTEIHHNEPAGLSRDMESNQVFSRKLGKHSETNMVASTKTNQSGKNIGPSGYTSNKLAVSPGDLKYNKEALKNRGELSPGKDHNRDDIEEVRTLPKDTVAQSGKPLVDQSKRVVGPCRIQDGKQNISDGHMGQNRAPGREFEGPTANDVLRNVSKIQSAQSGETKGVRLFKDGLDGRISPSAREVVSIRNKRPIEASKTIESILDIPRSPNEALDITNKDTKLKDTRVQEVNGTLYCPRHSRSLSPSTSSQQGRLSPCRVESENPAKSTGSPSTLDKNRPKPWERRLSSQMKATWGYGLSDVSKKSTSIMGSSDFGTHEAESQIRSGTDTKNYNGTLNPRVIVSTSKTHTKSSADECSSNQPSFRSTKGPWMDSSKALSPLQQGVLRTDVGPIKSDKSQTSSGQRRSIIRVTSAEPSRGKHPNQYLYSQGGAHCRIFKADQHPTTESRGEFNPRSQRSSPAGVIQSSMMNEEEAHKTRDARSQQYTTNIPKNLYDFVQPIRPLANSQLSVAGEPCKPDDYIADDYDTDKSVLYFARITKNAFPPVKETYHAAGFILRSAYNYVIPPKSKTRIQTDLLILLPRNSYGRIAPRKCMVENYGIDVVADVIDRDYKGNVTIVLINHSDRPFAVQRGNKVAQLICESIHLAKVMENTNLLK